MLSFLIALSFDLAYAGPAVKPIRCDVSGVSGHIGQIEIKDEKTQRPGFLRIDAVHSVQVGRDPAWLEVSFVEKALNTQVHRTYLGNQSKVILSVKTPELDVVCQYLSAAEVIAKSRKATTSKRIELTPEDEKFGPPESSSLGAPSGRVSH